MIEGFGGRRAFLCLLAVSGTRAALVLRNVTVVQSCDAEYVRKFTQRLASVEGWARKAGFGYKFVKIEDTAKAHPKDCSYTHKVRAINDTFFGEVPPGGWLIWVDSDIAYGRHPPNKIEEALNATSEDGVPCYLVAQQAGPTINSGVLLLRQDARAAVVVAEWIAEQVKWEFAALDGVWARCGPDQTPLQQVVAHSQTRAGVTPPYEDQCDKKAPGFDPALHLTQRNECFGDWLKAAGAPHTSKGLCLLSWEVGHPRLNVHTRAGTPWHPDDIFLHEFDKRRKRRPLVRANGFDNP